VYGNQCLRFGGNAGAEALSFLGRKLAPVGDGREVGQGLAQWQRPPLGANVASTAEVATVI